MGHYVQTTYPNYIALDLCFTVPVHKTGHRSSERNNQHHRRRENPEVRFPQALPVVEAGALETCRGTLHYCIKISHDKSFIRYAGQMCMLLVNLMKANVLQM